MTHFFFHPPAPSRPKFIDRVITRASSFAKRSPDSRDKAEQKQSRPRPTRHSTSCVDLGGDYVTLRPDSCTSQDNYDIQDRARSRLRDRLYQDGNIAKSSSVLDESEFSDVDNIYERIDDNDHSLAEVNQGISSLISNLENDVTISPDPGVNGDKKTRRYDKSLKLVIPSVQTTQELDHQNTEQVTREALSLHFSHCGDSLSPSSHCGDSLSPLSHCGDSHSPLVDQRPDFSSSLSPIIPGHVKRQRDSLILHVSRRDDQRRSRCCLQRSRSEIPSSSYSRSLSVGSPLSPQAERTGTCLRSYHSQARNQRFSQAVMAKGYVKALAEQINVQGSIRSVDKSEDDSVCSHGVSNATSPNLSPVSNGKPDISPPLCLDETEELMRKNLVKNLILAAEKHKSRNPELSPEKKTTNIVKSASFCKGNIEDKPTQSPVHGVNESRTSVKLKKSHSMKDSTRSPRTRRLRQKSDLKPSPHQSPSRKNHNSSSRQVPNTPTRQKPVVDYSSKPKLSAGSYKRSPSSPVSPTTPTTPTNANSEPLTPTQKPITRLLSSTSSSSTYCSCSENPDNVQMRLESQSSSEANRPRTSSDHYRLVEY